MIDGLARGLAEAEAAYGCAIVGGDLSAGPCLVVSVAITGSISTPDPVVRANARPGDRLFVTGLSGARRPDCEGFVRRAPGKEPLPR